MPKSQSTEATARLEARIPVSVYTTLQRAAQLRGMTLTSYLLATAGEDARKLVAEADILRLSQEDQVRFAQALADPPEPTDGLKRAARSHADLIAPR